jgi:hypothetical protein
MYSLGSSISVFSGLATSLTYVDPSLSKGRSWKKGRISCSHVRDAHEELTQHRKRLDVRLLASQMGLRWT